MDPLDYQQHADALAAREEAEARVANLDLRGEISYVPVAVTMTIAMISGVAAVWRSIEGPTWLWVALLAVCVVSSIYGWWVLQGIREDIEEISDAIDEADGVHQVDALESAPRMVVHEIATDGLPDMGTLTSGQVAFIFQGVIVSGVPLDEKTNDEIYHIHGQVPSGRLWISNKAVSDYSGTFGGVTHWVEFSVPLSAYRRP